MTHEEAVAEISHALALLITKIRSENLAGLFSTNRLAEDILLPVFRPAFNAPGLRNANSAGASSADIDLEDPGARIAIQVTSERSTEKVTETLKGFLARNRDRSYDRLIVFMLTDRPLRPVAKTKQKWETLCGRRLSFNPDRDVLSLSELLSLLTRLPHHDLLAVHDVMSRSVVGKRFVDVAARLKQQAIQQLENEVRATKYIRDIFVETKETKYLARCFSHPRLFVQRIVEDLHRLSFAGFAEDLVEAGIAPPVLTTLPPRRSFDSVQAVMSTSAALHRDLVSLGRELEPYEDLPKEPAPGIVSEDRRYVFDERRYQLTSSARALRRRIDERRAEVSASASRFFVLIGKAGQGKTNFVCDFVETFLWKHDIPCAYLSGRILRGLGGMDLPDTIAHAVLGSGATFADTANLLSEHAARHDTHFILVIDGLNEHTHPDFATQLEHFLAAVLPFPRLRVLMTCRSEFFDARFGQLFRGHFESETCIVQGAGHRDRQTQHTRLLKGYYNYFQLDERLIAEHVSETLVTDLLLLRFFCEAYGARGKPTGYQQPSIPTIYRDEIFEIYLAKKLDAGDSSLRLSQGQAVALVPQVSLRSVLEVVVAFMVENWQFSEVPRSVVPAHLDPALIALLDEDVILRADLEPQALFGRSVDTLSFTFDELRDYVVTQYLVNHVFALDPARFFALLGQSTPQGTTSMEGLKRFLFYRCRKDPASQFALAYVNHPWYADAYDEEVFNIPAQLVTADDATVCLGALRAGGARAVRIAKSLAVKWRTSSTPHLNLGLLLEFAHGATEGEYNAAIIPAFTKAHFENAGLATAFVTFLKEHIILDFSPGRDKDEDALFRLLAILLPVEGSFNLEGVTAPAMRTVGAQHPQFAVEVLTWALRARNPRLTPYVWRLLGYLASFVAMPTGLIDLARQEAASGPPVSLARREADRFLATADGFVPGGTHGSQG